MKRAAVAGLLLWGAFIAVLTTPAVGEASEAQLRWILFRPFGFNHTQTQSSNSASGHHWHGQWWNTNTDALAKTFDYRGGYRSFGLIVGDVNTLQRLSVLYPSSTSRIIAPYNPSSQLWVVECESRHGYELVTNVSRIITETGITVYDSYQGRDITKYIVEGNLDKLFELTKATFVPVPMTSVRPNVDLANNPAYQLYTSRSLSSVAPRDPLIAQAIELVSEQRITDTVKHLSSYFSRQSYSVGALEAQSWLAQQYLALGMRVITIPFEQRYSDNVIAELRGVEEPSKIIVLSAHYDSRSTSAQNPDQPAPGADDNASGTSNVLEIATVIASTGLKFKHTIRFCSWSGEEQGLRGSRAYAKQMREENVDIIAVLNSDMLGWTLPGTAPTLGMKDRFTTQWLLDFVNDISRTYVPTLGVGSSNSCCSDHQAFFEQGYPAVGYFENEGGASDYPNYHKSTDLPQYLNFRQITLMSKAIAAATLTIAEPVRAGSQVDEAEVTEPKLVSVISI